LKRRCCQRRRDCHRVAPRTGAWIETLDSTKEFIPGLSRPPHGGVD